MMRYIGFFVVILLTNIIQGITGFAGTILAMPPSLMLVGYDTAKPILNVLGILAGIYVFLGNRRSVNWKELKKIVLIMTLGILGGILIRGAAAGHENLLYKALGIFVIGLAVQGLVKLRKSPAKSLEADRGEAVTGIRDSSTQKVKKSMVGENRANGINLLLLISAGMVHGIFVSGGPLLISYLTKVIKDKTSFRATISTVWIILNTIILVDDLRAGLWSTRLAVAQLIAIPFFMAGMKIGSILYSRMSQEFFMKLTYVLLGISGVTLLIK